MANIAIYATKGFEYLWILSFLAVFTGFYLYLTSKKFEPALAGARSDLINDMVEWFRVPTGLLFHQGHTWLRAAESNPANVQVGLDDFAQRLIGKVDAVETDSVGARVKQGETGWSLRVGDRAIAMLSPVSGEIVKINKAFQNDDPFGGGWIYEVKPENLARDSKNLLKGGLARQWMAGVVEQLRRHMNPGLDAVYQDGGVPMPGIAKNIDTINWDLLASEYFLTSKKPQIPLPPLT